MTTTTDSIISITQYMQWLGIHPHICDIVDNSPKIKEEILYKIRHNCKNVSTYDIICKVLKAYMPKTFEELQKKI